MLKQTTALATGLVLVLSLPLAAQETTETPTPETTEAPAANEAPATPEAPAAELPEGETGGTADAAPEAAPMEDVSADTVVASIDGTPITLGQMIIAASQLPPQYQALPPEVLFNGVMEQLIQQEALASTLGDDPTRVTVALENERRALRAGEVVNGLVSEAITDEALRAAYDSQYGSAEPALEYNASHILVPTEEEAQAVVERLDAGEDFAALAQELSQDPGSGANGGQLGWFGAGMMVEPFQAAVEGLEPGAVSEPVETQFGWHVILLNETREQTPPAFEEVSGELAEQLQQAAIELRLTELVEAATIERPAEGAFDPAVITDLSLLEE